MLPNIIEEIKELYEDWQGTPLINIEKLPQSGGDRLYFRMSSEENSFIATYNLNIRENQTFFYLTDHFSKINCPVTQIFKINPQQTLYIQEDLGDVSLLNILEKSGYNTYSFDLFKQSLKELAHLQINADKELNYGYTITSKEFGAKAIKSDLLYFKYYFLDTLKIAYDKEMLLHDFYELSSYLDQPDFKYFMYRDFQSRNIMVRDNKVYFIDYQGGMKGALQYDVASLLWQAKANLPDEWKTELVNYYMDCVDELSSNNIDREKFTGLYNGYVLVRLLQVLGAYGFRGIFERKAHFLTSIPLALKNLREFLINKNIGIIIPEFSRILFQLTDPEIIKKFETVKADENTPLVVSINSFSYIIGGIPIDNSSNGGGFVFDCRGILNPGRIEEFKKVNGRNKGVIDFLEQQTKMPDFLNSIYNIVDISVENYIDRGFESLMISFGCTGGCHRSVYAADALARHLRNKFNVKISLNHIEQKIAEKKGY
ncbi:MAG: RNase adapter RapZ [Ginsengibacter sp.]